MNATTKIIFRLVVFLCFYGTVTTVSAQAVEIESTEKGLVIPKMTSAQRMAMTAPSQSELVYDITTKSFWYFEDHAWQELAAGGAGLSELISDSDGDTQITVESSPDEDVIRMGVGGTQALTIKKTSNDMLQYDIGTDVNEGNTLIGHKTGDSLTGIFNTLIGHEAGDVVNGNFNTYLGAQSGQGNIQGLSNTFLGVQSGAASTGSFNTYLGPLAGAGSTGERNIFIGLAAGQNYEADRTLLVSLNPDEDPMIYGKQDLKQLHIVSSLNVGPTLFTPATGYQVSVDGKIACEEVLVEMSGAWPDYVFESDYDLRSLKEVKEFIDQEGHLPGVPSAKEVEEKGLEVGEMNKILMEKIEELTLYILDLEARFKKLESYQD